MIDFNWLEKEKKKIRQMPLKELLEFGEGLFNRIKVYRGKEQKHFWSELESDCNFCDKILFAEILNVVFEKENPTIKK